MYEDLKAQLLAHKDRPAILNINIGTTVKGAVDDLDKVQAGGQAGWRARGQARGQAGTRGGGQAGG